MDKYNKIANVQDLLNKTHSLYSAYVQIFNMPHMIIRIIRSLKVSKPGLKVCNTSVQRNYSGMKVASRVMIIKL